MITKKPLKNYKRRTRIEIRDMVLVGTAQYTVTLSEYPKNYWAAELWHHVHENVTDNDLLYVKRGYVDPHEDPRPLYRHAQKALYLTARDAAMKNQIRQIAYTINGGQGMQWTGSPAEQSWKEQALDWIKNEIVADGIEVKL